MPADSETSLDISLKYVEIAPRMTISSPMMMTATPVSMPPKLVPAVSNCWVVEFQAMLTDDAIIIPPATAITPPRIPQTIKNRINLSP